MRLENIRMQAEVEDMCRPEATSSEEMTFGKSTEFFCEDSLSRSPKMEPPEEGPTDFCDATPPITKLDGINFEDDIEKVEINSRDSDTPEKTTNTTFGCIPEQNSTESVENWLRKNTTLPTTTRVVKYQDLPYMGEMTLDNSKPRRGRKPKKADICHLIYKNYGTIFPGTPNAASYTEKDKNKSQENSKTSVQNKIISSLLEKRLTQEYKNKVQTQTSAQLPVEKNDQKEPLNLCIRDLDHLKIRVVNKSNDVGDGKVKSEPASEDDDSESTPQTSASSPNNTDASGYVYWPTAGVFLRPLALQQHLLMCQRLSADEQQTEASIASPATENKPSSPTERIKKASPTNPRSRRTPSTSASVDRPPPAKRKRSAIFIPPIPAENTANPATEVSICKFKFTGGAKPSLQEKKMLSVDSGGNFRYYSGTGDKNMRGYEFFPREALQQNSSGTQGSGTGAFLQTSGEKIVYPGAPLPIPLPVVTPEAAAGSASGAASPSSRRKRRSRKSIQRERLEQTFKEKGFLIQTQQLESAEGATYCKFRQLRKFTRYLFRSWKDYLPGSVQELQQEEGKNGDEVVASTSEVKDTDT